MTNTDWTELREKMSDAIKLALSAYTSSDSKLMDCDLDDAVKDIFGDLERAGFAVVKQGAQFRALLSERDELAGEVERLRIDLGKYMNEDFALSARNEELSEALRKIVNYQPEEVAGVIPDDWSEQIKNCPECQRYKGHPIQNGICDTHRKPLYERDRQEEHLYRTQHIQMVYIAREALRNARTGEGGDDE